MNHLDNPSRTFPPSRTRILLPRQSTSGVSIPSSAVIGIGLGFVAFALSVLALLLSIRILKVRGRVRAAQRAGQTNATFHSIWQEQGGFFGFLTGGGTDGLALGAGGVADVTRIRRMLEEYKRWEAVLEREPTMHEIEVLPKGQAGDAALEMDALVPLAIQSSPHPPITERPRPPNEQSSPDFYVQIIISMPAAPPSSERQRRISRDEEEYDDLPELVIGSTTVLPVVHDNLAPSPRNPLGLTRERRIRWQIAPGGKWNFEGLG